MGKAYGFIEIQGVVPATVALDEMCKAANVTYKGFHSLRHTFATMMLENGTDIKTISDILGHSSVEITMDVYSHPSDSTKRKAVNKTFRNLRFE